MENDEKKDKKENFEVLKDYGVDIGTIERINLVKTGSLVVYANAAQH